MGEELSKVHPYQYLFSFTILKHIFSNILLSAKLQLPIKVVWLMVKTNKEGGGLGMGVSQMLTFVTKWGGGVYKGGGEGQQIVDNH